VGFFRASCVADGKTDEVVIAIFRPSPFSIPWTKSNPMIFPGNEKLSLAFNFGWKFSLYLYKIPLNRKGDKRNLSDWPTSFSLGTKQGTFAGRK
jgi:hypothetical protein